MYKDSNGDIWVADEEEAILQEMIDTFRDELLEELKKRLPAILREIRQKKMRTMTGRKKTYKGVYDRLDRIIYLLERSGAKQQEVTQ